MLVEFHVMADGENEKMTPHASSNNFSLEMKKKLIKSCIWGVALYGSETWTVGKNEERAINAFETWRWRRTLKNKMDR